MRMRPSPSISTLALLPLLALIAPACLDAREGDSADTVPDTVPDTSGPGDTAGPSDTSGPGDTSDPVDTSPPDTSGPCRSDDCDPCFSLDCDDGDPCTLDQCELGQCVHLPLASGAMPAPEPPECTSDADCADGDACTSETCELRFDDCGGVAWGQCIRTPIPGCGTSCDTDAEVACGDGDPCTVDACTVALGCTHTPLAEGLCERRCAREAVTPLLAIWTGDYIDADVTTEGTVVMAPTPCPDCDECSCHGLPALVDGRVLMPLRGEVAGTCDDPWDAAPTCAPLHHSARYLVWGRALDADDIDDAVKPTVDVIDVAGFCLAPEAQNLVGRYHGRIEVEAETVVTFEATLEPDPSGPLRLRLERVAHTPEATLRLDIDALAAQPISAWLVENRLDFALRLPWVDAPAETEVVHAFGVGNAYRGKLGPLFHVASGEDGAPDPDAAPAEDTLPYGWIVLERDGPLAP